MGIVKSSDELEKFPENHPDCSPTPVKVIKNSEKVCVIRRQTGFLKISLKNQHAGEFRVLSQRSIAHINPHIWCNSGILVVNYDVDINGLVDR